MVDIIHFPLNITCFNINKLWNENKENEARHMEKLLSSIINPYIKQYQEGLISASELIYTLTIWE